MRTSPQVQTHLKPQETGKPRVFEVPSMSAFIEVATSVSSDGKVIFRGQTKEKDWPLAPSVGRDPDLLRNEKKILEEFKRESIPHVNVRPSNYWQWLALAQHNRLPTRLLDWTTNPLAALWFAVRDSADDHQPGVVWTFHYEDGEGVSNTDGRESPFDIDHTYVYFPEHVFPFIQAQSGVFTVHHREGDNPGRFPPLDESIQNRDLT